MNQLLITIRMLCLLLQTFLELGASPNYRDIHNLTPLYHCVCNNTSASCAEMLLHDHSVVGVTDDRGWTECHQVIIDLDC